MKSAMKRIAVASVLAAGVATNASAATIVTNGSFEDGLTGWTTNKVSGTTPGIGITVIPTGVNNGTGYGDNVPNYAGTHAAYFVDDNANENLFQSVSLAANTNYTLSYALFATQSGAANQFGFALTDGILGTPVIGTVINNGSQTDVPVGTWTPYSYNFTSGLAGNYVLGFNFLSGATPAKDVLLDAVQISAAVPEPATWAMMLVGFGVMGGSLRRGRRRHSQLLQIA
jgi:hypothetical protein